MTRNHQLNSGTCVLIAILGFVASVAGCGKEHPTTGTQPSAVAKPVATPAKPVLKPVSSALTLPPPAVTLFDFSSKKDPFKPYIAVKIVPDVSRMSHNGMLREVIPIHRFDIGQFKLIGIITGDKENRAMVTDPTGKGYVLKAGMTIGKNEGRVMAITSGGVDVLEQFRDDNGKVRKERIRLALPRKQ